MTQTEWKTKSLRDLKKKKMRVQVLEEVFKWILKSEKYLANILYRNVLCQMEC